MLTTPVETSGDAVGWLADTPYMRDRRPPRQRAGLAGWMSVVLLVSAEVSGRSSIANGLIGVVVVVAIANLARIRHTATFVLPYLLYVTVLAFAVGTFPTNAHDLYSFLRDDGRIYSAVLPLIVLGTLQVRWADLRLFVKAVQFIVWADVLLLMAALGGVGRRIVLHKSNFFGLTNSHHAAGYFASAAIIILYAARKSPSLGVKPLWLSIAAATGLLVATGSRTSLVGLAGVVLWTLLSKRRASDVFKVLGAALAVGAVVLAVGSRFSSTISTFFSSGFRQQAIGTFEAGLKQSQSAHYVALYGTSAGFVANILARFWYWGIAISMILRSPIVGIGSFRYNDQNLTFAGVPHFIDFAVSGVNNPNLEGAHDQYLGALVETGVVGLVLLLMMWILPYRRLRGSANKPRSVVQSGSQMVPFAFATAFTGYTLAAPSLTFVALTWLTLTVLVPEPTSPDQLTSVAPAPSRVRPKRRLASPGESGRRRRGSGLIG